MGVALDHYSTYTLRIYCESFYLFYCFKFAELYHILPLQCLMTCYNCLFLWYIIGDSFSNKVFINNGRAMIKFSSYLYARNLICLFTNHHHRHYFFA